jgi:hypothetical protein
MNNNGANNGANNEQWRVVGCKKSNKGGVRDSPRQTEQNGTYSNEGDQAQQTQSTKPGLRKELTVNTDKAGNAAGCTKINGKRHAGSDTPNKEDRMEHFSVNAGFVNLRFMCGDGKGFNVARGAQTVHICRLCHRQGLLYPPSTRPRQQPLHPSRRTKLEGRHPEILSTQGLD